MSPTSVGLTCHPPVVAPTGILWEDDFATAAANTTAFTSAYGTKWGLEPTNFNVGQNQMLQAVWNTDPDNVIVSAATSGGTGNSLKLQAVRGDHSAPCIPTGGTTTIPFSTGGINSKGNTSGGDTGPYRITSNTVTEVRMRYMNTRAGARQIAWQTSYNRASAEIDYPEFFSIAGNGGSTGCTLSGVSSTTSKRNHWELFWAYSGSGTQRIGNEQTVGDDTAWNLIQVEWLASAPNETNSIKLFRNGQLLEHWGDPPWDARALFAGFGPTEPFKWASGYQGTEANPNGHIYPAPYDSGNISKLKLSCEIGGIWCQPIDPTALSSSAGTFFTGLEVDYVRVYDAAIHGAL